MYLNSKKLYHIQKKKYNDPNESNKNAVTVHFSVDNSQLSTYYLHHLALHVFWIFDKKR